jgi:magnesium chelatase subunit D
MAPATVSALEVFAVAPQALGGVVLRAGAGPERDAWLAALRALLPETMPWRRMPSHINDEALLGGLDLAATLAAGRPVAQAGLLAQAEGGIVVAAMAERIAPALASRLAAALDGSAALAMVALDEGSDDDEAAPAALGDRMALHLRPPRSSALPGRADIARIATARAAWQQVSVEDGWVEALVAAAAGLGIGSARAACHALVVARIAAALDGRAQVLQSDAALAAQLVLAPRATQLPPSQQEPQEPPPPEPPAAPNEANAESPTDEDESSSEQPLDEQVIAAALAAIPPGLLALLAAGKTSGPRRGDAGRSGQATRSQQRGRPIGAQRGEPRGGARLALIDTLRAAAPWQKLRRAAMDNNTNNTAAHVLVSRDDLRIQRRVQRRATTTIFAIDASGSQALHRLGEAKGAVELLLADCYARRDRVAVIGFRGEAAQLLLAPTRSLVRAKRQLAGLPGGGGTPLAAGIDAATALASSVRRGGATPLVVLLTDGRANIGRGGAPGRIEATQDALAAARQFSAGGTRALVIDTSAQASPAARTLAEAMGARCIVLPHAAAETLSAAVRQQRGSGGERG